MLADVSLAFDSGRKKKKGIRCPEEQDHSSVTDNPELSKSALLPASPQAARGNDSSRSAMGLLACWLGDQKSPFSVNPSLSHLLLHSSKPATKQPAAAPGDSILPLHSPEHSPMLQPPRTSHLHESNLTSPTFSTTTGCICSDRAKKPSSTGSCSWHYSKPGAK